MSEIVKKLFEDYKALPDIEKKSFQRLLYEEFEIPEWQKKEVAERLEKIKTGLIKTFSEKETFQKLGWK